MITHRANEYNNNGTNVNSIIARSILPNTYSDIIYTTVIVNL
jgi:hypothetical protein